MSSSEIAFLAIGLIIGAAVGSAISEVLRARPGTKGEVRVTIAPNSVSPRRSQTLTEAPGGSDALGADGAPVADVRPAPSAATPQPVPNPPPNRTAVPSTGASVPAGAVAVPVRPSSSVPVGPGTGAAAGGPGTAAPVGGGPAPGPATPSPVGGTAAPPPADAASNAPRPSVTQPGSGSPSGPDPRAQRGSAGVTATAAAVAVGVLDPIAPLTVAERTRLDPVMAAPMLTVIDVSPTASGVAVRPRPPLAEPRLTLSVRSVGVPVVMPARAQSGRRTRASEEGGGGPSGQATAADPCAVPRHLVDERCGLASASKERARGAVESLREAERAYDSLRELLDRAEKDADPRELAAAKDELHRRFRAASDAAPDAEAAEAAAREWLDAINELNGRSAEASRFIENGRAELKAALPRIERLATEAEAARIAADAAAAGCQDAREHLATCEEDALAQAAAAATPAATGGGGERAEPDPFEELWPGESDATRTQPIAGDATPEMPGAGDALALRLLRGDREARDRLVAALAGADPESTRAWHLRLSALVDAIVARAIEDGYLEVPDDDPFWTLFAFDERRDIIAALSALGYRFDGLRGWADGRVPAARDLGLAVGYAGLDRMRVRTWPRDPELAALYERATVASDEWLIDNADDLSLGRMVDALGARASDLADVWNAWGRIRTLLLAAD